MHSIENSSFSYNSANLSGGAVFYDLMSPKGLINNTYRNNSATYG